MSKSVLISPSWLGAPLLMLAGVASAQTGANKLADPDAQLRQEMERVIQKCISDKTASPYICRASAYATALAQGYPADRAARITGYKREDR